MRLAIGLGCSALLFGYLASILSAVVVGAAATKGGIKKIIGGFDSGTIDNHRIRINDVDDLESEAPPLHESEEETINRNLTSSNNKALPEMCHFCFETLIDALYENWPPLIYNSKVIDPTTPYPMFVTWEKYNPAAAQLKREDSELSDSDQKSEVDRLRRNQNQQWRIRGCQGTPYVQSLDYGFSEFALRAAFRDSRFEPILWSELPTMRVTVSLLESFETCNINGWELDKHGILIEFFVWGRSYIATALPRFPKKHGWTHMETIENLIRNAGYKGAITQKLLDGIRYTKYEASECQVTYDEYKMATQNGVSLLEIEQPQPSLWSSSSSATTV